MTDENKSFDIIDPSKKDEQLSKQPIGQGKTLADLKKEAELKSLSIESIKSNKSSPKDSQENQSTKLIEVEKVDHASALISLLRGHWANSRERTFAENTIRNYFKNNK